jgi:hypothetical protein
MLCPSHPPRSDHRNNIWWSVQLRSSSLCSRFQPLAASSLLGPNIPLSTLFSNSLNLYCTFSATDHISNPYK